MPDYRNIVDGLREMIDYPTERLDEIVKNLHEAVGHTYLKHLSLSVGPDYHIRGGEEERLSLQQEYAILTERADIVPAKANNLHIFEFNEDECWSMQMTDNDRSDEEIHIPYPMCFLDVDVEINGIRHTGILLGENEGIFVDRNRNIIESVQNIEFTRKMLPKEADVFVLPYPNISAAIFAPTRGIVADPLMPYVVRRYSLLPINQEIDMGLQTDLAGNQVEVTWSFGTVHRERFKEYKAVEQITLNFLDLLDTPYVRIAHIPRKEADDKRLKRGKIAYPPRERVMLTLPLRQYIHDLRTGEGHAKYSHMFDVRGHWRHYRSDRYAKSGLQGTKQWILPYIKGQGIYVKKKYGVELDFPED